jgi:hypothetical protein
MHVPSPTPMMFSLSRLAGASPGELSDAELLERFRVEGEEATVTLLRTPKEGHASTGTCHCTRSSLQLRVLSRAACSRHLLAQVRATWRINSVEFSAGC